MNNKAPLKKRRSKAEVEPETHSRETASAADPEELEFREFCEADSSDHEASPEFKENLRKKLMQLVKNLYGLWVIFLGGMIH